MTSFQLTKRWHYNYEDCRDEDNKDDAGKELASGAIGQAGEHVGSPQKSSYDDLGGAWEESMKEPGRSQADMFWLKASWELASERSRDGHQGWSRKLEEVVLHPLTQIMAQSIGAEDGAAGDW
ncbi:UNVERIFIED_CONTAM: hypothetical protein K2H54_058577 [Gekko kuhli]